MSERYGEAWVCLDCYMAHHYSAHQEEFEAEDLGLDIEDGNAPVVQLWFAGEDDEPVGGWHEIHSNHSLEHNREPLWALDGFELADNTCSNHTWDREMECPECGDDSDEDGIREFSWRACDGCHSPLGGSRHRLSLWKRGEVTA